MASSRIRDNAIRTLAQLGPRLTDDVISIHIDDDGLRIHTATYEHAADLAYLLGATADTTEQGVYEAPYGVTYDTSWHTWTTADDETSVLFIVQVPRHKATTVEPAVA